MTLEEKASFHTVTIINDPKRFETSTIVNYCTMTGCWIARCCHCLADVQTRIFIVLKCYGLNRHVVEMTIVYFLV